MDARQLQQPKMEVACETVAVFVQSVLLEIQEIKPAHEADVFVRVESSISLERLCGLLKSLVSIQLAPSEESLKVLQNFLAQRWERILKTDAVYPHSPYSQINRVCLLLAQKLAIYLHKHPFELLMPTAENFMNYFPFHTADSIRLTDFIIRDNGTPLGILDGFKLLERQVTQDSGAFDSLDHIKDKKLSPNEDYLLSKHSSQAQSYSRLLKSHKSQAQDRAAAKKTLEEWMAVKDETFNPASSYEVTGKKRLAKLILQYVGDRKKLVALFAHTVPLTEWDTFQAAVSDDDYFRYMGGVDIQQSRAEKDGEYQSRCLKAMERSLKILLASPKGLAIIELSDILLVVEDVERKIAAIRAYTYCLLQLYKRVRSLQPETTSLAGRFFTSTSYACSKEEKLAACSAIEKILINQTSLRDISLALEGVDMIRHHKAIQDGQLGSYLSIVKCAIDTASSLEDPSRQGDWVRTVACLP